MEQSTSDMVLTLRHWHTHKNSSSSSSSSSGHEVLFVGKDYFSTIITTTDHQPPLLLLHPLPCVTSRIGDHRTRRGRRRRQRRQEQPRQEKPRCSSPSSTSFAANEDAIVEESNTNRKIDSTSLGCSILLNNIQKATLLAETPGVRLLLLSSEQQQQQSMGDSYYDVLEIDCCTRNAVDLLGATLQSQLPSLRWQEEKQQHAKGGVHDAPSFNNNDEENNSQSSVVPSISPCSSSHSSFASAINDKTYNVDMLTAACMQATAAQESLSQKLERRWSKAVHEWKQLANGGEKDD